MELSFRRGTLQDIENFIRFLDEVKAGMSHKEWFYLDAPDDVRAMIHDGIMRFWLALDDCRLAAVFSIVYPGLCSSNYGYDLDLTREELLEVIHMDTAAVYPDYRGLGLQGRMVRMAEKELSGEGRRILLTTVHPENIYSLNNMQTQGYEIQKRVEKYDSVRYILRKNIF